MRESTVRRVCAGVLASALVMVGVTVAWGVFAGQAAGVASGFAVGEMMPASLVSTGAEQSTLFVFLRRDCPASRRMAAWLPALTSKLAAEARIRTVAVFPEEGGAPEIEFAESVGIESSALATASFRALPLVAVPAFVLTAGDGAVQLERAGIIDESARPEFLRELSRASR